MKTFQKLFFILFFMGCPMSQTLSSPLDTPPPDLLKLLAILGIQHDGTLVGINKITQEKFLRKPGQERWEMEEVYEDKRFLILPLLEKLGVIYAIFPSSQHYDTIIIHGAVVETMRQRLRFLDTLWSHGIRGEEIVFLTGERPLDPILENEEKVFNQEFSAIPFRSGWCRKNLTPSTEADIAPLVWDQVISQPDLRKKTAHFVRAPMKYDPTTGQSHRPSTKDTVLAWLATSPKMGRILAISNNPYIPYQHQAMLNILEQEGVLKKGVTLETVGSGANSDTLIAVHLDNLARWIYARVKNS